MPEIVLTPDVQNSLALQRKKCWHQIGMHSLARLANLDGSPWLIMLPVLNAITVQLDVLNLIISPKYH